MKKYLTKSETELLDKFATAALQGLLAEGNEEHFKTTTERAYRLAELMLKARSEKIKQIENGKK